MKYLTHVLLKLIKQPKLLLDYKNYIIKLRFHLWPVIPKSKKKTISLFETKVIIEDNTLNGRGLYSYREFKDKNERELIINQIPQNSICIDIGSNIGFYTIFLLKKKVAKKVYSFEDNKKVYEILMQNTKNLNCIQTQGRVGFKEGQIKVDNKIDKNDKIDFIKIDIDGEDFYALKSCEKIIEKYKPKILIEISESSIRNQGISFLETIKYLNNFGYTCYYANSKLEIFDRKSLDKNQVMNIFCKVD